MSRCRPIKSATNCPVTKPDGSDQSASETSRRQNCCQALRLTSDHHKRSYTRVVRNPTFSAVASKIRFCDFLTDYYERNHPYAPQVTIPAAHGVTAILDGQQRLTSSPAHRSIPPGPPCSPSSRDLAWARF